MTEKSIQGVMANLAAITKNEKSGIFSINGKIVDNTNLQDAISGKKLKGDVKIDLDGDGIFDVSIKAKDLAKTKPENIFSKVKNIKGSSEDNINYGTQLNEIEGMLKKGGLSDSSIKNLEARKKEILKEFEKTGTNPEDFKKRAELEQTEKEESQKELKEEHIKLPEENKKPEKVEAQVSKPQIYTKYVVQEGETPASIAKKVGLEGDKKEAFIKELLEHNKDAVKSFKGKTTGKEVKGFFKGAEIELPGEFDPPKTDKAVKVINDDENEKVVTDKPVDKEEAAVADKKEPGVILKSKKSYMPDDAYDVPSKTDKKPTVEKPTQTKSAETLPKSNEINKKNMENRAYGILKASRKFGTDEMAFIRSIIRDYEEVGNKLYGTFLTKEEYQQIDKNLRQLNTGTPVEMRSGLKEWIESEFDLNDKTDYKNRTMKKVYDDITQKGL